MVHGIDPGKTHGQVVWDGILPQPFRGDQVLGQRCGQEIANRTD